VVEIIPAILPKSFSELEQSLFLVRGLAKVVQIDICDGLFVPSSTVPYTDRARFDRILKQEEGMPSWEDFDFEMDLMVNDSAKAADEWVRAGASRILIHIESPDDRAALEKLQPLRDEYGVSIDIGLAISLDTPLERLETLASFGSTIQSMGIAKVGYQGEALDERVFDRISELARLYPQHVISVDGGVTLENAPKLASAGARRLVVGSHLFSGNVEENYRNFKKAVGSTQ
jgi:ribulose-phosphate 3-epimerase